MSDTYNLVTKAKNLGYACEVYYIERTEYNLGKEKEFISSTLRERGFGVRLFKDGYVGFAFDTRISDSLLDRAMSTLKVSEKDPSNEPPPAKKPNLLSLNKGEGSMERAKETLKNIEDIGGEVNLISVQISSSRNKVGVISSEGVDVHEVRTSVSVSVIANYKDSSVVTPELYETGSGRSFEDVDIELLKEEVINKVKITKSREKLDRKSDVIILTTKALSELLHPLLAYSVNAENVYRKRTPLNLGEEYGSLSVIDNPREERSEFSRSFDGEGQPTSSITLFENGIFKNFLTNWFWSRKMNVQNSASAIRSFMSVPTIGTSTIEIVHEDNFEEDGLVIDQVQGVHTSSWDSGEFSVVAPIAWITKKESKRGVREVIISGDLKTLLRGVIGEVGQPRRISSVKSANLAIKGLSVVY
ncbi:MAG: TldD/PmbA family protein [Metallosphaera sp.]